MTQITEKELKKKYLDLLSKILILQKNLQLKLSI